MAEVRHACELCETLCPQTHIEVGNKHFCCHGCAIIFDIEHDLGTYSNQLGKTFGKPQVQYEVLDDVEFNADFLTYQSDRMNKMEVRLNGIHCSACILVLEQLNQINSGIINSRLNFAQNLIQISFDPRIISLRQVAELLEYLGYPPNLNPNKVNPIETKSMMYKLGIAGFVFGNVMLFSFPEYLGMEIEPTLKPFFRYLSLILSIPVVFYCANHYFNNTIHGLRMKQFSIDLPITLGILSLFIKSAADVLSHQGSGYFDSLCGFIFFLLIGKWYQERTFKSLSFDSNYYSFFPMTVLTVSKDKKERKKVHDLEVNDQLYIRNNEIIPADIELLSETILIDNSFITGESEPQRRNHGDILYAGGRVVGDSLKGLVLRQASQSYLSQIWAAEHDNSGPSNLDRITRTFSKYFTLSIIAIAVLTFIYWQNTNSALAYEACTSVLIVACPCVIALALPFIFGSSIRLLSSIGCYVRSKDVLTDMQKVNYFFFDKTGTLTLPSIKSVAYHGISLSQEENRIIYSIASKSSHPLSRNIVDFLGQQQEVPVLQFKEIPGVGLEASSKNEHWKIGKQEKIASKENMEKFDAHTQVHISRNDDHLGYFSMRSLSRDNIQPLLHELQSKYALTLVSGDNDRDSIFIKNLGLPQSNQHYNLLPEQKQQLIKQSQQGDQVVCMVGDGINDSLALEQSNVGIVVTDHLNNFNPSCDVILWGNHIQYLDDIFDYIRNLKWVIILAYSFSILYNIIGLFFAVQGKLSPIVSAILMPISSISVVLISLICTRLLFRKQGLQKSQQPI